MLICPLLPARFVVRVLSVCLGLLLLGGAGTAASCATTVTVLNPAGGAILNKDLLPSVYIVNGMTHNADTIDVQVDGGAVQQATVKGAAWELALDLSGISSLPGGVAHQLTVTPRAHGVAGTPVVVSWLLKDGSDTESQMNYPFGDVEIQPGTVVSGVYAGKGAGAAGTVPVGIKLRMVASLFEIPMRIEVSEAHSAGLIVDPVNFNSINDDLNIPTSFTLGGAGTLPEGVTYLTFRFLDTSGAASNTYSRGVLIDYTPPTVNIAPSAALSAAGTVVFGGQVQDSPTTSGAVPSGIASVEVLVKDGSNNVTKYPASLGYGADVGSAVNWRFVWTPPANGTYRVRVVTTDNAGNVTTDDTLTTNPIVVSNDGIAPTAVITSPGASAFLRSSVPIQFTLADNSALASYEVRDTIGGTTAVVGSGTVSGTSAARSVTWNTNLAADGAHSLTVHVVDLQGNTGDSPAVSVTVDNTLPLVVLNAPRDGMFLRGTVNIAGAVFDANPATWKITLDGNATPLAAGTGSIISFAWDTTQAAAGAHQLNLTGTDRAGNTQTTGTIQVIVDNTPPVTNLLTPRDGDFVKGITVVKGTATDSNPASWTLWIDGQVAKDGSGDSISWPWDTTYKLDGDHTLRLDAADRAGNVTTGTPVTVHIDNTRPGVTITGPVIVTGAFLNASVTITGLVTDAYPDTWEITVDGISLATGTGTSPSKLWNPGTDGVHNIEINATDKAGNKGRSGAIQVTVDRLAPTTSFVGLKDGDFVKQTVSVAVGAADANLTKIELFIDNVSVKVVTVAGGTGTLTYPWSTLGKDGTHTLRVVATDRAGNTGAAQVTVTADNLTPVPIVSDPVERQFIGNTYVIKGTVTEANLDHWDLVANNTKLATGTTGTINYPWDTRIFLDGVRAIRLTAWDKVGNVGEFNLTVFVDNTAPVPRITNPTDGDTVSGIVNVTGLVLEANPASWKLEDIYVLNGVQQAPILLGQSTTNPNVVVVSWDTGALSGANRRFPAGTHLLRLTATDQSSKTASTYITVTVR